MKHNLLCRIICLTIIFLSSTPIWSSTRDSFPFRAEILPGYEEDKVKQWCDATDLQPIEGIWYYPDEKLSVVIERCSDEEVKISTTYRIVLIDSDDMSLLPGTIIGYCEQSAEKEKYRMWIYSEQNATILENLHFCVAALNKDCDELIIERSGINIKVRVNFARFLPQLLKGISIVPEAKKAEAPEGFRKIYPGNNSADKQIIYL